MTRPDLLNRRQGRSDDPPLFVPLWLMEVFVAEFGSDGYESALDELADRGGFDGWRLWRWSGATERPWSGK